jgi:hypothetical protein
MSFTCPKCRRTSYHPEDERFGYCGACKRFTGSPYYLGTLARPAPPIPGRRSARPGPLVALFRRFDMILHSYGPVTAAGLILLALAVIAVLEGR